jgi:hypothetical protein
MNALSDWPRNRLLLALSSSNLKRLMPELEQVHCQPEQVLMDADSALEHVYFPDSGVISIVAVYSDGSVIEMATIGREGCTGLQAVFGAKRSSVRLLVQLPRSAARMSRSAFTRSMESMPSFRNLMVTYVEAFLEQVLVSEKACRLKRFTPAWRNSPLHPGQRLPGRLLPPIQPGICTDDAAPRAHHTGPNVGTAMSSGQRSALSTALYNQDAHARTRWLAPPRKHVAPVGTE